MMLNNRPELRPTGLMQESLGHSYSTMGWVRVLPQQQDLRVGVEMPVSARPSAEGLGPGDC